MFCVRQGQGQEVLYLHGWGCSHEVFASCRNPSFCETLPDLYGFGETPAPTHPVDLDYYVEGVKRLMDRYYMQNVVVVAHSFGARIAVRLAATSPHVVGLVLVGAAGMRPRRGVKYLARVAHAKLAKLFRLRPPEGSEDYRRLSGAMKGTFVNIVHTYQEKELSRVTVPVLLVWGAEDKETPPYMLKRFEKGLPLSRTVWMERCGHFCFAQQPDRFRRLVATFVEELQ